MCLLQSTHLSPCSLAWAARSRPHVMRTRATHVITAQSSTHILKLLLLAVTDHESQSHCMPQRTDLDGSPQYLHQAWYWACVTVTTIGYGDYYPGTVIGQMLFPVMIILILIVVPTKVRVLLCVRARACVCVCGGGDDLPTSLAGWLACWLLTELLVLLRARKHSSVI